MRKKGKNIYALGGLTGLIGGTNSASGAMGKYDNTSKMLYGDNKKEDIDRAGQAGVGALSGAAAGYSMGKNFGTMGALVGGIGGAVYGGVTSYENSNPYWTEMAKRNADTTRRNTDMAIAGEQAFLNNQTAYTETTNNIFGEGGSMPFTNNVTVFNNGGTHEQNPNNGIPQGIGANGQPNKVEEGEVKYNNYIYSNRLKANKKILEKLGLPLGYEGSTFGEIAEKVSKESKERPNDPISKTGLDSIMNKLQLAQEAVKQRRKPKELPQEVAQAPMQVIPGQELAMGGNLYEDGSQLGFGLLPNGQYGEVSYTPKPNGTANPQLRSSALVATKSNLSAPTYWSADGETSSATPLANPDAVNTGTSPDNYQYKPDRTELLRYAPVLGSIVGLMGNKKDYTNADAIGKIHLNAQHIGDKAAYKPLDRNYYLNTMGQNTAAARSAAKNSSGGNRGNFMANTLASDYNYNQGAGVLARQAEEFNRAELGRVKEFNRGTNQVNMQADNTMMPYNADYKLKSILARQGVADNYDAAKSANMTNLFNSVGDIGREAYARNMISSNPALYYTIGRDGSVKYKTAEYAKANKISEVEAEKILKAEAAKASTATTTGETGIPEWANTLYPNTSK